MSSSPRIVVVAAFVPRVDADNAGQRYLGDLARLLPESTTFIVHGDERAKRDIQAAPDPRVVLLTIDNAASAAHAGSPTDRLSAMLHPIRARAGFWEALRDTPRARNAIARADIIDLQWPEFVSLAPRITRVAPGARIIATMHDVHSQNLRRQASAAATLRSKARRLVSARRARRIEHDVCASADLVVVFSEKDQELLPSNANTTVVHPAAASAHPPARIHPGERHRTLAPSPKRDLRVLSIGPLTRGENLDGLEWFANEVWPAVHRAVPDAELVHAGSFDERQRQRVVDAGVTLLGFVDDLAALQREVGVVIAPIRQGAGVKFKVVDALHDELPIVATSVGTEGIGDGNFSPESFDTPREFATAVIMALTDPVGARLRASEAGAWARERYGWPQFARSIRAVYGLADSERAVEPATAEFDAIASVVIPVRNGETGLPNALAALARQREAGQLEVIIADNGSTDRTREVAEAWRDAFHTLRIVDAGARPGVNFARNTGLLAASTDRVLFCDHDDEARVGWATGLLRALDEHDIAGGKTISSALSGPHRALDDEFEHAAIHSIHGYLPYVAGGSMGVRRSVALEVGGFDESFQRGHDEVEFCWRLQRAGYSLAAADDSVLDYRQRDRAVDAGRQRFHSARTAIQLWARYEKLAPLAPVSFAASIRGMVTSITALPALLRPTTRFDAARRIGWSLGTFVGHLRYRKLGAPPSPILLPETAA